MAQQTIRIATRRSRLAMWQANHVKRLIENRNPGMNCELLPMSTSGDVLVDRTLQSEGGKGLFLKELEQALVDNQADLAVHSMKDVPIHLEVGLTLKSIGERGSAQDVFVSNFEIYELPVGSKIGTSSSRRRALLAHVYKRSEIVPIRGNVETRLRKLDEGEVDGLVLAAAGLERLELEKRVRSILPKNVFVPAVGQGVLAAEFRDDRKDILALLSELSDPDVETTSRAERLVAEIVGADCAGAFGVHCEKVDLVYKLTAIALSDSGERAIQTEIEHKDARAAAEEAGQRLLKLGAAILLGAT